MNKEYIGYIKKVARDATKAAGKPDDVKLQVFSLDNKILVAVRTQYASVKRRIYYRLLRNFEKRYRGVELHILPINHDDSNYLCMNADFARTDFDLYPLKTGYDPNYGVGRITVFGVDYNLRCHKCDSEMRPATCYLPGEKYATKHIDNLLEHYGIDNYMHISWEEYCKFTKEECGWEPHNPTLLFNS